MSIFIDGFEQFRDNPRLLLPLAGYGGASVFGAEGRRPGGAALLVADANLSRTFPVTSSVISVGAAVRFSARRGTIFEVAGVSVGLDPTTGFPTMLGAFGQTIPITDKFYYFEIELDWSAGRARFFINGKLDIDTALSGPSVGNVTVRMKAGFAADEPVAPCTFDDFYFNDGPRLGPVEVLTQLANQNASPQQWATSEDTDEEMFSHAAMVGEPLPDPLEKYILSDEVGAVDTFTSSTTASRNDVIKAASIVALARVTARTGQPLVTRSGSLTQAPVPLGLTYQYHYISVAYPEGTQAGTVIPQPIAVEVGAP